ncbi:MAG: hypothetical protein COA45_05270 [Zetaproteobacteria bacterium]|nr:MAG: hypothetical protein COA45_05270 [Zetaproteobacteria bacterium]
MHLILEMRRNFFLAAQNNPPPREITPFSIETKTFQQILAPIKETYLRYGACSDRDIGVHALMEELRQMCLEAHAIHTTQDSVLKENRSALLNALQGLTESMKGDHGPYLIVDFNDLYSLSKLTETLRNSATIYREYMHYPDISDAIDYVADYIESAKLRSWTSEDSNNISADVNNSEQNKISA